jgi:predicted O-methyltransferase YrrM
MKHQTFTFAFTDGGNLKITFGNKGMYSTFQLTLKYLNYYFTASSGKGHGIHSPFVFDFITKVLNDKTEYADYEMVENHRQKLLQDKTVLAMEDYGAGSSSSQSNLRSVASIAKHVVKPKKYSQLLYRFIKYYQPKTIIELGTSLGITTSYLSLGKQDSNIFTLEGATEVANAAKQNFKTLELRNIRLIEGNFDYTLPAVLYQLSTIDFAFIDGNHRREPTLNYFNQLLAKTNNNSLLILDDIHWSQEMEQAWNEIKEYPAIRCTLDLFFIGIILFRQEFKEKQHFTVRF